MRDMERLINEEGFEARQMTWEQLGMAVGYDARWQTIQRAMKTKDYSKYIACLKGYVSENLASLRVDHAKHIL